MTDLFEYVCIIFIVNPREAHKTVLSAECHGNSQKPFLLQLKLLRLGLKYKGATLAGKEAFLIGASLP
jgi:hypothetical protein